MNRLPNTFYHVTTDLDHTGVFTPRVPENRMDDEDETTPRVCVAPTLDGCFSSAPFGGVDLDDTLVDNHGIFKVFEIDVADLFLQEDKIITPEDLYERYGVDDALLTGEHWILDRIVVPKEKQRIIHVTEFSEDGHESLIPYENIQTLLAANVDISDAQSLYKAHKKYIGYYPDSYFQIYGVKFVNVTEIARKKECFTCI